MQSTFTSWVSLPCLYPSNLKARLSSAPSLSFPIPLPHPQISSEFQFSGGDSDSFSLPSHVNFISSTANPFVKHCVKLHKSSSYRHSHSSVLVVGTTPIRYFSNYFLHLHFLVSLISTLICILFLSATGVYSLHNTAILHLFLLRVV